MLLEAEEKAEKCDVSVVVLGSSSSRFTEADFDANGAARLSDHLYMDCGEGMDPVRAEYPGSPNEAVPRSTGKEQKGDHCCYSRTSHDNQ